MNPFLKRLLSVALLVFAAISTHLYPSPSAAADTAACQAANESCLTSCKRFKIDDARFKACGNFCGKQSLQCEGGGQLKCEEPCGALKEALHEEPSTEQSKDAGTAPSAEAPQSAVVANTETSPETSPETSVGVNVQKDSETNSEAKAEPTASSPEQSVAQAIAPGSEPEEEEKESDAGQIPGSLPNAKAVLRERAKDEKMVASIKMGHLKEIRKLIAVQGLNPTFAYTYEHDPVARRYIPRISRLRLTDIFNDTNTLHSESRGLDSILSLFLELGMDVNATLATTPSSTDGKSAGASTAKRTAWGPSLRKMETARDGAARFRAFELAVQGGMKPNDDFSDWLFAELPQVCGRDKSTFAIQAFDLLVKHVPTELQDALWRNGDRGAETLSDVIDRSVAPAQAKYAFEKSQFARQDEEWEQCAPLSRRIKRFMTQGT